LAIRLHHADPDFDARFEALLGAKREVSVDVSQQVAAIIDDVRMRGDDALVELSARFDGIDLAQTGITVSVAEIDAAIAAVDQRTLDALQLAAQRIESHHAAIAER
jgi:histidinol dehydrogenase